MDRTLTQNEQPVQTNQEPNAIFFPLEQNFTPYEKDSQLNSSYEVKHSQASQEFVATTEGLMSSTAEAPPLAQVTQQPIHKKEKTDIEYPCDRCRIKFSSALDLQNHEGELHIRPHFCIGCEMAFTNRHAKDVHETSCKAWKLLKCLFCDWPVYSPCYLHEHEALHRVTKNMRQYCRCLTCSLLFDDLNTLKRHMKSHALHAQRNNKRKRKRVEKQASTSK